MPLIDDLTAQAPAFRRVLPRLLLFGLLLFILDRGIAGVLVQGLERYYGLDKPAEVLLIGHSQTMLGIDHQLLARELGVPVAKYARQGATLADRQLMIRQFLARHPDQVRMVVYGVDAQLFNAEGLSHNSYRLFLPFIAEPVVREYFRSQNPPPMDLMLRTVLHTSRFEETTVALAMRGLMGNWRSYKEGVMDETRLRRHLGSGVYRPISFDPRQIEILRATINDVRGRDIGFLLVLYPTIGAYNEMEPAQFDRARELLRSFADEDPNVDFADYSDRYSQDIHLFFDPIHLNRSGQHLLTSDLAREILGVSPPADH